MAAFVQHSLVEWMDSLPSLFVSDFLPLVHIDGAEPAHAVDFVAVSAASFAFVAAFAELYTFAAVGLSLLVAVG